VKNGYRLFLFVNLFLAPVVIPLWLTGYLLSALISGFHGGWSKYQDYLRELRGE